MNYLPKSKKRIAVAMSGGVDSSLACYLLAKAGHEVVGFTAWTLNGPGKCCNDALINAGRVCETLGVQYDTVDLRAEFAHFVMDYYHNSYEAGLTPNPCVECNRHVKWERMITYAREQLGADLMATGHFARLVHDETHHYAKIYRANDAQKDQTYMMTRVAPQDLAHTVFPVGEMTKAEVYALAQEVNLPTAYSKESQDICFVLNGQANYMKGVFGKRPGPIVDVDTGKTLGEHEGTYLFTVGQRKGVNVAAGRPIYVINTDPATNTVYVGDKHHLESSQLVVKAVNWLVPHVQLEQILENPVTVKLRYSAQPVEATVMAIGEAAESNYLVKLAAPQTSVVKGQIAAFYDARFEQLLGGGYIEDYVRHKGFDPTTARELPDLHCQLA